MACFIGALVWLVFVCLFFKYIEKRLENTAQGWRHFLKWPHGDEEMFAILKKISDFCMFPAPYVKQQMLEHSEKSS